MNKIIILDYATAEVHIHDFPDSDIEPEDFLLQKHSEHGLTFKESQCHWMIVDLKKTEGRLPVYIH